VIHAQDDNVIMRFGLEKPVFRIVVNTLGTLGTTGLTTAMMPSMTLGSGGVGGAITGDNISVHHMYNTKRLAYEINPPPEAAMRPGSTDDPAQRPEAGAGVNGVNRQLDPDRVDDLVRRVLAELNR
jgi:acetaldehyde dehydrogenase (acetylating)